MVPILRDNYVILTGNLIRTGYNLSAEAQLYVVTHGCTWLPILVISL